ncbi:MAG: hypothetical protein FWC06_06130 [Treponema sp.]|nr:hypothetical protein [Treponema sp.]
MDYEQRLELIKKYLNFTKKSPRRYSSIVENFPEFLGWVDNNKIKLKRNLIKATFLTFINNGKNYDLIFTQDIGQRFKPSTGEWIERRNNHFVAKIENVPLDEISAKYNWIMGR